MSSIKIKFIVSFLIVVTAVIVLSGTYSYFQQSQLLYGNFNSQIDAVKDRLGIALPTSIWNFNESRRDKIISAETKSNDIKAIALFKDDQFVAGFVRQESEIVPLENTDALPGFSQSSAELVFEAEGQKEPVGAITVYQDDSSVQNELRNSVVLLAIQLIVVDAVLVLGLYLLLNSIVLSRLGQITDRIKDIAEGEGDLRSQLDITKNDELGTLSVWFNKVMIRIRNVMTDVASGADEVSSTAQETKEAVLQAKTGLLSQHSETDLVASAINEMTATIHEVARHSQQVADAASEANSNLQNGKHVVSESINAMESLSDEVLSASGVISKLADNSNQIGSILDVIKEIADQTNLLALNAAIEAARAGEQGRSFAVVADEVRTLAQRTQESTREIEDMIERIQGGATDSVEAMTKSCEDATNAKVKSQAADSAMEAISSSFGQILDMTTQIATASEEQTSVVEEINRNITNIAHIAEQTVRDAETTVSSNEKLAELAVRLDSLMKQFRL